MGDPHIPQNRPSDWLRTLWVSRRLVAAAVVVGILVWFIASNNESVTVHFPFGLGRPTASIGLIVLVSAIAGSLATVLLMTIVRALGKYRPTPRPTETAKPIPTDRPPADYGARTPEGFPDARWPSRDRLSP